MYLLVTNAGGGLAVGTVLLVEEDTYGSYANLMVKYFIAEAVVTGQSALLTSLDTDPESLVKELPAPITDDPKDPSTDQSDPNSMKIAWRYQNKPRVQSNQTLVKFGHYYDLTKCIPQEESGQADINKLSEADFSPDCNSPSIYMNPRYCRLLQEIDRRIQEGSFSTDSHCDRRNILRIAVHSLGSPQWGEGGGVSGEGGVDHSLPRFLYALRTKLRSAYACCLLTVPTQLFQERSFVDGLERLCDTVVHLESFAGSQKEKNPAYREYHGLLHLRQLPRLNSLVSHMPDTLDLAFKLRRKKFTIEKLHLPPELSETASRNQEDPAPRFKPQTLACGGPTSKLDF